MPFFILFNFKKKNYVDVSDVQRVDGIRKSRGIPSAYDFHACDINTAVSKLRYINFLIIFMPNETFLMSYI